VGIGRSFSARWGIVAAAQWRAATVVVVALCLVISGGIVVVQSSAQRDARAVSNNKYSTAMSGFSPVPKRAIHVASTANSAEANHADPPASPDPAAAPAQAAAPARTPARAPAPAPPPAPAPAPVAITVPEVLALVNGERANAGLAPLAANASLNSASAAHASWMSANGVLQHSTFPGGWHAWGENIAQGYGSAASVVAGWMGSPGHRANILNPAYSQMGIGYVAAGNYWCQQFGG
jgi:uncharacterized protein YkwD